ncbi:hypothetical protein KL921_002275 [Ogataea angusta]|uniref:Signal peptidase complex catalytic subunit SEC11 n=1 Tax=Pichia angusta TaxID=870730 RepID=A0AAN6DGU5_PICAN|nr:uncharacterized protein KL928_002455 [Ogataea angusta]KAG7812009.1 hypothetical protein KL921_002275 [Ogataea angusta]KAG7818588.1 hypothetical protein KL909_004978 [Ogataea angusta]KAG7819781.1 hypothetical protein KL928_002455 [Ogataea angusta]KAG7830648.1 hypothetical protein KL920_001239 [Ogataea angusta]KAG7835504.1 hypothetical protein KL942_005198 [Ogataea angusta]
MNLRQQLGSGLSMAMVLASAFAFWKLFSIVTMSNSPIVVVLSGSMEPAFQRGDVLFLWNREEYVGVGDVVVYKLQEKDIPIVHRVVREHRVVEKDKKTKKKVQKQLLLTKGDNNERDDLPLYAYGQQYLERKRDILGRVFGYVPLVGYVTILITENVYFKYALMALLGLSALVQDE